MSRYQLYEFKIDLPKGVDSLPTLFVLEVDGKIITEADINASDLALDPAMQLVAWERDIAHTNVIILKFQLRKI